MFLSYIQADGYNPLTVEASVFVINDKQQCDRLANLAAGTAVGNKILVRKGVLTRSVLVYFKS